MLIHTTCVNIFYQLVEVGKGSLPDILSMGGDNGYKEYLRIHEVSDAAHKKAVHLLFSSHFADLKVASQFYLYILTHIHT